ncbi:hypothetical protein GCM10010307_71710 [Streptomyces vastus]|uniref:Uncharacterized protein n=1 Tax=Streptomyces vastus TaxID=285451 RepID=A0ABP6E0Q4_9ACTN
MPAARLGNGHEDVRGDLGGRSLTRPDGRGVQGVHPVAQPCGQHLLQLGQRAQRGLLDSGDRSTGRRAQADHDGDGLVVVKQQRRQRGPGTEPVTNGSPGGLHRVAEFAQPLHVTAERACLPIAEATQAPVS